MERKDDKKNKKSVPRNNIITPEIKREKNDSAFIAWIKNNKTSLGFGVVGLLIGVLVMFILWPERIAKLKDGGEVIVKIEGKQVTADELFNKFKDNGAINALLEIIDDSILEAKYDLQKESEDYAKEQSEYYFNLYESSQGLKKEEFLEYYGFKNEQAFIDYLKKDYLYQHYFKEYVASKVKEEDVKKYYKDNVTGTKKVYVFTASTKKNDLENVRKALKKGTSKKKIAEKYPNIDIQELDLDFTAVNDYSTTFIKKLNNLEAGKYSEVFEDPTIGYTVIYVREIGDKPSMEDAEKDIREILGSDLQTSDNTIYYKAFIELRKDYGIKFYDTGLQKEYDEFVKKYTKESSE